MRNLLLNLLLLSNFYLNAQQKPATPSNKGAKPIVTSHESRNEVESRHMAGKVVNQNTYAVVVGISDYQDPGIPDLRFADKDAEAFTNFLRSPAGGSLDGDHLKVLTNEKATAGRLAEALDALIEKAKKDDQVIIYFSGHGDVEGKKLTQPGFLLCWDSPSRVYMGGGTYSLSFLQEVVSTLSIQNQAKVVVITDACHAGKLAGSQIGGSQLTTSNLAKQYANELKILSCQPNEFSVEGPQWGGGRGVFSYHLVEGLYGLADRNNDGQITLGEIDRYLEDHVTAEAAPQCQVPILLGNKTDHLANVNASILADLKKNKIGNMPVFASTESRGFEDEVLARVDTNIRGIYQAFKLAVKEKRFFEPAGNCAEDYYTQLNSVIALAALQGVMRRNYAAALPDDAQQVLNEWMKTGDDLLQEAAGDRKGRLPYKLFTEKVRSFPRLLGRAAELLGKGHYMYATLQARKYFFEGYLLSNSDKSPNQELGEKALTVFRKALGWQAELPQAYWQMSRVYGYNLIQLDSAEVYAQKAIELNPTWVLPPADLAFMLIEKYKQFDRAKLWLEQAMRLDSNSTVLRNSWGLFFLGKKEYLKAEQQFKKAIQLDSFNVRVNNNLGKVYHKTRRYDEAEQQFKKAIQLDSTLAVVYSNLGNVYLATRRYTEAEQQFKKAIQLDSTYVDAYFNLGFLYFKTRRYEEAEQQFKKAIQLDSTPAVVYFNLGNVYLATRRYTETEQQYKKAIQLDSTYTLAYNGLGVVYNYTRRYDEAEQQYKKAIRLDSTFALAYYNLACLHSLQNQTDEAFGYLENALKNGENDYDWMLQDSDLAPLRDQKERWEALMKQYFPEKHSK